MLSNKSLAAVIVSSIIGTATIVVILMRIWTTLHRRPSTIPERSGTHRTLRRAHDAELGITPYDLELEMLADPGEDFDHPLKIDLNSLFDAIDHCANTHFRSGTRKFEDDLETEKLLQQTVIVEDQVQHDGDVQLGAQRLVSLLRDPKQRKDAAHHFILSSICAALNIQDDNAQRSLVPADYMSFVRSLREPDGSQCTSDFRFTRSTLY